MNDGIMIKIIMYMNEKYIKTQQNEKLNQTPSCTILKIPRTKISSLELNWPFRSLDPRTPRTLLTTKGPKTVLFFSKFSHKTHCSVHLSLEGSIAMAGLSKDSFSFWLRLDVARRHDASAFIRNSFLSERGRTNGLLKQRHALVILDFLSSSQRKTRELHSFYLGCHYCSFTFPLDLSGFCTWWRGYSLKLLWIHLSSSLFASLLDHLHLPSSFIIFMCA